MKKTLTFNLSTIPSTASRMDVDAFDRSVEAFDRKEYLTAFHTLLDFINPELRPKYGNPEGTEFEIPHGSIVVHIRIADDRLWIEAPFLSLPAKGRIPLMRQTAVLNICYMDLARIALRDEKLYFEYDCPLALAQPAKIYYVLRDICRTGDRYDDEFVAKFHAERIYEPRITPYDAQTVAQVYDVVQLSCRECMDLVAGFESERNFGYAWNIIATTLLKICYCARPQGQLLNDLDKAIREHDREDIPLTEVVARSKQVVLKLQAMSCDELAGNLYFVETFVPDKMRSSLKNIQENFCESFKRASAALERKDYLVSCLSVVYKFYEMYYYNNLQDDVNAVALRALTRTSAMPLEEAAPILVEAMEAIMEGELDIDEEEDTEDAVDIEQMQQAMQAQAMAGMQQMMQGVNMTEYMKQAQAMQAQAMAGMQQMMQDGDMAEYMKQVQEMQQKMAAMFSGADQENK